MDSGGGRENAETAPEKRGGQGSNLSTELSVNKQRKGSEDCEWADDKPLPKAGRQWITEMIS
jgi:hypothetical protein